jgi:hypothetical protein
VKRWLLIILVLGGACVGLYYQQTGRFPWTERSPEELQVVALREEFSMVRQQWKQAGRAATFGMDTSTITERPLEKLEHLERSLADLEPRLRSSEARTQAGTLRAELAAFKAGMK